MTFLSTIYLICHLVFAQAAYGDIGPENGILNEHEGGHIMVRGTTLSK